MDIYIGKIIKILRLKKEITQKDLAQNICSQKQLLRIEQNQSAPNSFLLYELSNRLGKDLLEYLPYCNDENAFELKNLIDHLENLYDRHMYNELKSLLDTSEILKRTSNIRALQISEWLKGAISNAIEVDYKVDVHYYLNIYRFNDDIKTVNDIFKSYFTDIDCRIINAIIVFYLSKKNYDLSEKLLLKTIEKIEYDSINGFHGYYAKSLYNLSRLYLLQDRYEEAIQYSKKGVDHCVEYNALTHLADLYNILGRAWFKLGHQDLGKDYLRHFINVRRLIKNDLDLDNVFETLIEKYKL